MRKFATVALFCLGLSVSYAQNNAVRGGISGVVTDQSGAVVPNANVLISGPQGEQTIKSDGSGAYTITGLTPGFYKVTVSAGGFSTYVSSQNEVVVDHSSSLNIKLALGEAGTTISVEGGITQLDLQSTSLNTAITDTFYNAVPVARGVAAAFYIAPGVVSGGGTGPSNPSIGGASGLENVYVADGVTITDQAYGGLGVYNQLYGSLGSGINLAFIKEVDVKTGAFEPKYGRGDGGIAEIITKSGTSNFHGALSLYLTPSQFYAARFQPISQGFINGTPSITQSSPLYEASAEIGGYIPHFRDKLFFFGAFDPTLRQAIVQAYPNADGSKTLFLNGPYTYDTTTSGYAGKLTYAAAANTVVEASHYGDPSRRNGLPETLATSLAGANSVASSYQYGTRNSVIRANSNITPTWNVSAAYTYNYSVFREQPKANAFSISNRLSAQFVTTGFGASYPTKNDDYGIQFETEKKVSFFGEHTFQFGYLYDHTNFEHSNALSGTPFAIPSQNANGAALTSLYPTNAALSGAVGQTTTATFRLFNAASDGSCTKCAKLNGKSVYLQQIRGAYKGNNVLARARYQVLYGNETYKINKYVTANLGLRWEQQHYAGTTLDYLFNDNWSPRLGVNIDPFGDHKTKVFFNYARYQNVLPLDAAIRQLGNEQDDANFYYTPVADASGNAVLDSIGAVQVAGDSAHLLNGLPGKGVGASFGAPSFSSSTGEGILPGTRMEYENEYIIGIERQVSRGSVFKIRYMDRRLGRIVEDNGSQSPEGAASLVDANYAGGIANITKSSDYFVNENEVVYSPAQFSTANPGQTPGSVCDPSDPLCTGPGVKGTHPYIAAAAGCTYANDTSVQNGDFFKKFDGSNYNGACITNSDVAGSLGSDGKPDGFAQPLRHYQALEIEYNRNLTSHFQARVNYRYAKLFGNYEGFFRNDNGQSDPGISSLFDFTAGALGLLGDQFAPGYLNSDRRHVVNGLLSYTVGSDTPHFGKAKGLTVGMWYHVTTGAPLSAFQSHPVYGNTGEVPVGGRGNAGTLTTATQLDMHADDTLNFGEKYRLKLAFDGFNATNSQWVASRNQNLDTSLGVANPDYGKVTGWQTPFYGRGSVVFSF